MQTENHTTNSEYAISIRNQNTHAHIPQHTSHLIRLAPTPTPSPSHHTPSRPNSSTSNSVNSEQLASGITQHHLRESHSISSEGEPAIARPNNNQRVINNTQHQQQCVCVCASASAVSSRTPTTRHVRHLCGCCLYRRLNARSTTGLGLGCPQQYTLISFGCQRQADSDRTPLRRARTRS